MLRSLSRLLVPLLCMASVLGAQSTNAEAALPASQERHHRVLDEDKLLRVMRVVVKASDSTRLHAHERDHFWIAIGPSEIVDSVPGEAAVRVVSANYGVHFAPAGRTHVLRNDGRTPFENFTVEFAGPQTNVRNLCGEAIAGAPKDCPARLESPSAGVRAFPAFETDQVRVTVMSIAPGATLTGAHTQARPWFVAWDVNAQRGLRLPGTPVSTTPSGPQDGRDWGYGTWRPSVLRDWYVSNTTTVALQVLVITPKGP